MSTKSELREICRTFLDEGTEGTWTNARLDQLLNISYERRRAQIIGVHRLDFVKTFDYTYPASTTFVTFDTIRLGANAEQNKANEFFDIQEWVFVEDIAVVTSPVEVPYVPWIRRHEVLPTAGARVNASRTDVGYFWTYKGREFWLVRTPSTATALRLHVIPPFRPFQIAPMGEEERPEFTVFDRIIAIDAAILARESTGEAISALGPIQAQLDLSMVRAYEERNSSEPDYMIAKDSDFNTGRGAV